MAHISPENSRLSRQLTQADAVIIGLNAMIGAGIFVAIGPAVGAAGGAVILSIAIAAFAAFCNATSSAQLAALYPESGGTYVYGRKRLGPFWGWMAGWCFVAGKVASCAAAALTFGFYFAPEYAKPLAAAAVVGLTVLNLYGVKKSAGMAWAITLCVLAVLTFVMIASLFGGTADFRRITVGWSHQNIYGIMQSAGIMFFAFAGYARIATLGEEVKDPRTTIPNAIVTSLSVTALIYAAITLSAISAIGIGHLAMSSAPLVEAVNAGIFAFGSPIIRFGAAVAAFGVLLSLILGISRTIFAMAGEGDIPRWLSAVHPKTKVPHRAEIFVALMILAVLWAGDIRSAIGFSAFTVLLYYAITNACAYTLPAGERLWPRFLSVAGLLICVVLAFALPLLSLITGVAIVFGGMISYALKRFSWKNKK